MKAEWTDKDSLEINNITASEVNVCNKTLSTPIIWHNVPAEDAVKVVRCKDCKYLNIINKAPLYAYCGKSNYIFHLFEEDTREHFCSWGERIENETD